MAVYKSKKSTKDGRTYFFRIKYKDILGNTHDYTSPKYKTLKEATNEEALYRIDIQKQKTNFSNVTINEAFNKWYNNKYIKSVKEYTSQKLLRMYEKYFETIKNKKINDFNLSQYENWYNNINKYNFTADYKNKILSILRNIIKYSKSYYNTSAALLEFIENYKDVNVIKTEMDFFTLEEYKKFDSVIDDLKWHTFFEILYFLGLRKSECRALLWKDIDFKKNEISITKTLNTEIDGKEWVLTPPKTKNSIRRLPLPNCVINDLKNMQIEAKKYKDYNDNWFIFGNSKPFKKTTIENKKNNYCKLSNNKQIRVHDFRHSCASFLINNGASIMLVSKYLGHSKVSITLDVYSHFYKSELNNITEIINRT